MYAKNIFIVPISFLLLGLTLSTSVFVEDLKAQNRLTACVNNVSGRLFVKRKCNKRETTLELSSDFAATNAAGAVGADGAEGPQGAKGDKGPQGSTGPQGPAGATGATGSKGADGAQGPQGSQGDQGLDGDNGPVGGQGGAGPSFGLEEVSQDFTTTLDTGNLSSESVEVDCPSGKKVIGGSCSTSEPQMQLTRDYPKNDGTDIGWRCEFYNASGGTLTAGFTITARASCANAS